MKIDDQCETLAVGSDSIRRGREKDQPRISKFPTGHGGYNWLECERSSDVINGTGTTQDEKRLQRAHDVEGYA